MTNYTHREQHHPKGSSGEGDHAKTKKEWPGKSESVTRRDKAKTVFEDGQSVQTMVYTIQRSSSRGLRIHGWIWQHGDFPGSSLIILKLA